MRKKVPLTVIIFLILGIIFLYFILDVKERFEIDSLTLRIYKIDKRDTLTNCYILSSDINSNTTSDNYVVGLRIQTKWVSIKHEGFSALFRSETDLKGHNDTILKINLFDTTGNDFLYALQPGNIEAFKFVDTVITNHSVRNPDYCFISRKIGELKYFKDWYNAISWKDPAITDMFFFSISKEKLIYFLNHKITLRFEFKGGRIIESDLH